MSEIVVATDGSSLGNPGPSGWAWFVSGGCWAAGGMASGTNQQAELFAVLAALRGIPSSLPLLVRTDSQYTLKSCTEWMSAWKARGWRKADGSPVMNLALMKELDLAMGSRRAPARFEWVRGHRGDRLNESADARCTAAARAVRDGRAVPQGPGWVDLAPPAKRATGRPDLAMPEQGPLCQSCSSPINPYSLECRCSR